MAKSKKQTVTLIPGDGVGVEISEAVKRVFEAAGANIEWDECEAGEKVFLQGNATGVTDETINSIKKNKVALKGPLTTPVGSGEKSANVTLRKYFETFGNTRPIREIPGIKTPFTGRGIDFVTVRENLEDLYAGIEHMQTPGVAQALKLVTRKGCEKIVRLAFEIAVAEGRKSVHCATKSNILKLTEGMLKRTFEDVAKEYPKIKAEHLIIDNCAHQLMINPEQFEVIVCTNLHGDIISDQASGLVGGLGIAPSANIGSEVSIFEAVHGSAPPIAGKDIVNPTAFLLSAVGMLKHMKKFDVAMEIENAIYYTIEQGKVLTADLAKTAKSAVGTKRYTDEVIKNLGKKPTKNQARKQKAVKLPKVAKRADFVRTKKRKYVGFDLFIESDLAVDKLGKSVKAIARNSGFELKLISNRGVKVFPVGLVSPDVVDHWHCRFMLENTKKEMKDKDMLDLVTRLGKKHKWMHIEKLDEIKGAVAATKSQGEF